MCSRVMGYEECGLVCPPSGVHVGGHAKAISQTPFDRQATIYKQAGPITGLHELLPTLAPCQRQETLVGEPSGMAG